MIRNEFPEMGRDEFLERVDKHRQWHKSIDTPTGERLILTDTILGNLNLEGVFLDRAIMEGCSFVGSNLNNAHLCGARIVSCGMAECSLVGANLSLTDMRATSLRNANLTKANLSCTNFTDCFMNGVNLSDIHLYSTLGNGVEIKSINVGPYKVAYTSTHLSIGCTCLPIREWWDMPLKKFVEEDLSISIYTNEVRWTNTKSLLKSIIEMYPASPYRTNS